MCVDVTEEVRDPYPVKLRAISMKEAIEGKYGKIGFIMV